MQQIQKPTQNKLLQIIDRASNLEERIDRNALHRSDFNNSEARRQQWAKVVAKGDVEKFERRLQWSGIDPDRVLSLLGDRAFNEDEEIEIPSWAETLQKAIAVAPTVDREQARQFFIPSKPQPFEDFYLPFLQVAESKLLATYSQPWQKLSQQAQTDMWQGLLVRLASIGAATLIQEFDRFRLEQNSLKDLLKLQLSLSQSDRKYRGWLERLMAGFGDFLLEYSVLGRLLATATDFWVSATADFITHLDDNWGAIEANYSPQPLREVVACECNLSDVHNQGKAVIIVTFNTRLKLVYKPRDLSLEIAFYELIDWCNERSQLLQLPSLKLLNYGTHGWSEYIVALPCEDEAEVKRFYRRSGMSICLIHVLAGQDFHRENLIAKGEFPVLVDLEALLHGEITPKQIVRKDALGMAYKQLAHSVFKTHLLPQQRSMGNDASPIDLGGLGNTDDDLPLHSLVWRNVNTDDMQLNYEPFKLEYDNSPILEGLKVSAANYTEDVTRGFESMYGFMMANQAEFLVDDSPLTALADRKVRFIFRNTSTYSIILQQSYHPDLMRYGIDRSIALDVLSRGFLVDESKPPYWEILQTEIQSMENLDIPLFTSNSSSKDLYLSESQTIPQILFKSSFQRVRENFQQLSNSDRQSQLYFIKSAFTARFRQKPQWSKSSDESIQSLDKLDSSLLIQRAISIAESIEKQAILGTDGTLAWFGLDYKPASKSFNFQAIDSLSWGDGNLGIALFFAGLSKVTSSAKWQDLAWQILIPTRILVDRIINEPNKYYRQIQIGGVNGLAASAYSLTKIAKLLDAPSLVFLAEDLLSLISLDRLNNMSQLDVAGGCGGTLLSLLGCMSADFKNPDSCLEKAIACGDYLLKHQAPAGTKIDPKTLNYWSGISGVAYGLLRLAEVTQNKRYRITAINAIALESAAIDNLESEFLTDCARIDIALGRLAGLPLLDTPQIRTEIERGRLAIAQQGIGEEDNLFWGNCGRLEILLLAAQQLGQPQLASVSNSLASAIARKNIDLTYPSFLHGSSGIGYELLRVVEPQLLPSILVWE